MANGQVGGTIVWNLDVDDSKFKSGLAQASAEAKTFGNNLANAGSATQSVAAKMGTAFDGVARSLEKVVLVGAAVGTVGFLVGKKFIDLAGDLQTTERRMASLAGSTDEAKRIFGELYNYTLGKPIAFPDASKAAQTLLGYGVASKDVVNSMKTLSAFSIVNGADMSQLALAYGQVNAKGKLMGQEILQLTNNFVPVSQVIAKHFNVSIAEAQALMEGGKVSAEDFNKAMAEFIPQEEIKKQSDTFQNRMISLQGTIRSLGLALLGVRVDEKLGLVVEPGGLFDRMSMFLDDIAKKIKEWKPTIVATFQWMIDNKEAILGVFAGILAGLIAAKGAAIAFNIAANANPYTLLATVIIGAITALGALFSYLQQKFGTFTPLIEGATKIIENFWNMLQLIVTGDFKGGIFGLEEDNPAIRTLLSIHDALVTVWDVMKGLFSWVAEQAQPLIELIAHNELLRTTLVALAVAVMGFLAAPIIAIGLVIAAITALVGAFLWLTNKAIEVGMWIKQTWENTVTNVKNFIQDLINFFQNLPFIIGFVIGRIVKFFIELPGHVANMVSDIISFISQLPGKVYNFMSNMVSNIQNWLSQLPQRGREAGNGLVNGFIDFIGRLPGMVGDIFSNVVRTVSGWAGELFNRARQIAGDFWNGFKEGLGIHSPSYIEKAFMAIGAQSKATLGQMRGDISQLNNLGGQVVGSFQPTDMAVTGGTAATAPATYNINIKGLAARSRTDLREIGKDIVESINEELRAKGAEQIGGGSLEGGMANG